jgi:hypothetical protein
MAWNKFSCFGQKEEKKLFFFLLSVCLSEQLFSIEKLLKASWNALNVMNESFFIFLNFFLRKTMLKIYSNFIIQYYLGVFLQLQSVYHLFIINFVKSHNQYSVKFLSKVLFEKALWGFSLPSEIIYHCQLFRTLASLKMKSIRRKIWLTVC